MSHWEPGKAAAVWILEPEDLPALSFRHSTDDGGEVHANKHEPFLLTAACLDPGESGRDNNISVITHNQTQEGVSQCKKDTRY
jgi:hypothetical protein